MLLTFDHFFADLCEGIHDSSLKCQMLNPQQATGPTPPEITPLKLDVLAGRARSATGSAPGAGAEVKRWSANRKKEVVLRLLRGEPVDAISREVSLPIYRFEE
jgi:hypothetical protein